MIRKFYQVKKPLVFLLLFTAFYSYSAPIQTVKAPFMWHIKTAKANLYLAGSIHALNKDYYPFSPAYINAFDTSDQLVVEINTSNLDPITSRHYIKSLTWLEQGRTLSNKLSQQDIHKLIPFAKRTGMPIQTLLTLRPWVLLEMITQYQIAQTNFQAALGVDQFFIQRAQDKNKKSLELESLAEQINAINGAEESAQIAAISLALSQLNQGQTQLTQLANFWQAGNERELYLYRQNDIAEQPQIAPLMEQLLDKRNKTMAAKIATYLEAGGRYFVMVGALHLSGPNSVQNELNKRGYKLVKVTAYPKDLSEND